MRTAPTIAAVSAALALSGCASLMGGGYGWTPGQELVGRTLALTTLRGQRSTLGFNSGGIVRAGFNGRVSTGSWWAAPERLCFRWGAATVECWPYRRPFRRGNTVRITSDRGNVVDVTLL